MNFFEHQARARTQTRWLVFVFLLAVVAVVVAVDAVVLAAIHFEAADRGGAATAHTTDILLYASLATLAVIVIASLYKTAALSSGGGAVARALGGELVPPETTDPKLRRLRNVVEEMAIASGVPVPEIYWLPNETGINAFAAGYTPADAAVAVTRGCIDKLSRDELQGVVAHEFSHVLNGDMRLNLRLMGLVFGLLVLHVIGRAVLDGATRGRRSSGKKGDGQGAIVMVALALMIIGWIGVLFGRLIKAAVSRSREFLADASAVQFTRQTLGIAGALKKIGGVEAGSRIQEARAQAEEVAHMFFGDGLGYSALFQTHPPLVDRIRRLDPQFKPEQLKEKAPLWNDPGYAPLLEGAEAVAQLAGADTAVGLAPAAVASAAGRPGPDDYRHAEAVHAALPEELLELAHDPERVETLAFALLLDGDSAIAAKQLALVTAAYGQTCSRTVEALAPQLTQLHPALRLPLLSVSFPAVRHRPREWLLRLLETVSKLIHADGHINAFEFSLGRLLRTQVTDALQPAAARMAGRLKLPECRQEIATLLSALAQHGHAQADAARRAFAAGAAGLVAGASLEYRAAESWVGAVDDALRRLDQLTPPAKELLLEAMVKTIAHDARVTVGEAELLRVVCAALHCPLPPLMKAN